MLKIDSTSDFVLFFRVLFIKNKKYFYCTFQAIIENSRLQKKKINKYKTEKVMSY